MDRYTKNRSKILDQLNQVVTQIDNSIFRYSASGVPHIVVDSKYSICYFKTMNYFKIWTGYATPKNKKYGLYNSVKQVVEAVEELRRNDGNKDTV